MTSFPLIDETLPGGLRTLLLPRSEGETVSLMALIGVGSRYETARQWGLSHFLEHMFFKGTETRPDKREIAEVLDRVGAEFNAFTAEELTAYYVKVPYLQLELAADVVSDILLRSLFPVAEIEREKGVIAEEIRMYTDNPMYHVHHLWLQVLFGQHPLGRRIDGSLKTVRRFQRTDFLRYTKVHYHTRNTAVAVAGRFELAPTQQALARMFSSLPAGRETTPRPAPARVPARRLLHERRASLDQSHLMVGVPGVSYQDERRYAAEVLATILGGGMSSRLFLSVREERGLAYAVRASSENFTDGGSLVVQAGLRTDKTAEALALIWQEFDRLLSEPVSEAELHKVKQMLRGRLVMGLEETNAQALFAGGQALLEKRVQTPEDLWGRIEAVTPAGVQRLARELLPARRRAVALLSPHRSVRPFQHVMAGG